MLSEDIVHYSPIHSLQKEHPTYLSKHSLAIVLDKLFLPVNDIVPFLLILPFFLDTCVQFLNFTIRY